MRERFSRYARHESDVYMYVCTIKCGINTYEREREFAECGGYDRGMEGERQRISERARERETTLTRLRWMTRRVTRRVPTVGGRKESVYERTGRSL